MATATKDKREVDADALRKVDQALREIERRTRAIEAHDAKGDQMREERNLLVYRTAAALRPKTGGKPGTMQLARAMNVSHSYVGRVIEGQGHPVAAHGRKS